MHEDSSSLDTVVLNILSLPSHISGCIRCHVNRQALTLYSCLYSNSIIHYIIWLNLCTNSSALNSVSPSVRDGGVSLISETWAIILYNSPRVKCAGLILRACSEMCCCDADTDAVAVGFRPVGLAMTGSPLGFFSLMRGQTIGLESTHATLHWVWGRCKTTIKRCWKMSA